MPKTPRDTRTYDLKQGKKIVYRGESNDLEQREEEHKREGMDFSHIKPTSRRLTKEGALRKEKENLQTYRKGHGGKNPLYNKDDDG